MELLFRTIKTHGRLQSKPTPCLHRCPGGVCCFSLSCGVLQHTVNPSPCVCCVAHGIEPLSWPSLLCGVCRVRTHGEVCLPWGFVLLLCAAGTQHRTDLRIRRTSLCVQHRIRGRQGSTNRSHRREHVVSSIAASEDSFAVVHRKFLLLQE
jgi:hypothetical protein